MEKIFGILLHFIFCFQKEKYNNQYEQAEYSRSAKLHMYNG